MDALEFARELKRMCDANRATNNCHNCGSYNVGGCSIRNLEKILPSVEKWSKEHPITRNVDHVAEGLEKLGFKVDKEYLTQLCPPPKSTIFCEPDGECNAKCEECHKWWLEEWKGEE